MKNFPSLTDHPSFLSGSTPTLKSPEALNALPDHSSPPQSHMEEILLKRAQKAFDGLLDYVYCTSDDIIEIANQIEKNCSSAEALVEILKNHKVLLDKSKDNDSSKISIQEKSLLCKRPNPYLDELDKETLEILKTEPILKQEFDSIETEEFDSIETEGSDTDLSISTRTVPKSYQDQETQTSPILSLQDMFQRPPQLFLYFNLPQEKLEKSQGGNDFKEPVIVVQPVYFIEPQQLFVNYGFFGK